MSCSAVGSFIASTIAIVAVLLPLNLYAPARSAGPRPDGSAFGDTASALTAATSVRNWARQVAKPGAAAPQACTVVGLGAAGAGAAPAFWLTTVMVAIPANSATAPTK